MNCLRIDDLEIVGFNGAPQVECGRTLPVARRRSDGMHCVLRWAGPDTTLTWHDEGEASSFAQAQRWTRLREPLAIPSACVSETGGMLARQPMMVHASRTLIDAAGRSAWPPEFAGESLAWRRLEGDDESVQATCASAACVEDLMNAWGELLLVRFDALYRGGQSQAELKRVADLVLCAARRRSLRWQAYLRYALTQQAERVRPTFDAFTRHEFPSVSWESFLDAIKTVGEVLMAAPGGGGRSSSSPVTARPKVQGIAAMRPIHVMKPAA